MSKTVIINSEILGSGNEELGQQLMGSFLRKLWGNTIKPARIIFYNSGVRLLIKGSPVLDALDGLAEQGVDLIACGTCVRFYDIKDEIQVGRVSDMNEIAAAMMREDAVVTV